MQEKCLDEGNDLTLEKAIRIGQNYEASHASLKVIGGEEGAKVNKVTNQGARPRTRPYRGKPKLKPKTRDKCGYDANHTTFPAIGE